MVGKLEMRGERGEQDRTQQHGKKWRPAVTEIADVLKGNREYIKLSLNYLRMELT